MKKHYIKIIIVEIENGDITIEKTSGELNEVQTLHSKYISNNLAEKKGEYADSTITEYESHNKMVEVYTTKNSVITVISRISEITPE